MSSEFEKLREEQRKRWQKESKKDEKETESKIDEKDLVTNHNLHESIHVEIAIYSETLEEANAKLKSLEDDSLIPFNEGTFIYYKSTKIQKKYGFIREADEPRIETLLPSDSYVTSNDEDSLLQAAIIQSLTNYNL